jgi:transposase
MENRKVTQRFYTTKDAATYLGLAPRTLQKYRVDGSGPKFRKVRCHSFYDVADLDAWVESAEKTAITFDKR